MDCAEFMRMMNSCPDGDLEGVLQAEGENHLADCPDCCGEVADWQICLDWLRKTFPEDPACGTVGKDTMQNRAVG